MDYQKVITKKKELEKLILELIKRNIHTNGRLNDIERIHLVEYQQQYLYLKQIEKLQQENEKLRQNQKKFMNYLQNMLDNEQDIFSVVRVADVLSKYEEIIGSGE